MGRDEYRYGEEGQRIRAALFDAEASGDTDAVREHEDQLNDLRLENSGAIDVSAPQTKRWVPNDPVVAERGEWECRESVDDDSDGFTTPGWTAYHKVTGESRILHLSRFRMRMTPERFAWLVDNNFPRHSRGNWDNASIDEAMKGEPA